MDKTNYLHVDDPDFHDPEVTITTAGEEPMMIDGNGVVTFPSDHKPKKKIHTRSYKTELADMTASRDRWQAIAISSFISIAILITALAYKIFQS
jgi:hypothetical protein